MISIVEAAEQKLKEYSDDDINAVHKVVLLPDNVDSLTDDQEAQDNHVKIGNGFPSGILGTNKVFLVGKTTMIKWRMMVIMSQELKMKRKNEYLN